MPSIPVEDRFALQELSARCAVNCETKRYNDMSQPWAQDGTWDATIIGLPLCEGRRAMQSSRFWARISR
jgi:hypothetical protein